ncbi:MULTISPECIES: MAE_28990/MAE_18760 family HEPN-like nuclease [unclassified Lentimonas]|uniref:MAE_28990/MAE_18760 family HEPN-like nuclease n=1 Tax=unclassified Lentimonas TaxID=2630993 RepID=UPI0013298351|nr:MULTISPECIES: MAE_28990/MAE_18760 family HEPN-like nuclease [unclassified Lentimonas]CAA6694981.1 Unannotated [Lentimonas sp. CC19]CAA6695334.1 Unannotated [Lentimonas sp. CC10]CAA7072013.1 Unannotated [Lentimonas sp. CC11]
MFQSDQSFAKNLEDLIGHLNYEKSKGEFLKSIVKKNKRKSVIRSAILDHISHVEKPAFISAKQFTYRSSIISLYGFLENFLESLVHEFISNLNQISVPVELLPKSIRESHLESSIDLLKKVQRNRTYSKDRKNTLIKDVVSNMNSLVQEDSSYQLNESAFSIHTSNFRYDTIHNTFCKLGIPGIPKMALRNPKLKKSLSEKYTIDSDVEQKVLVSLLTAELDDLAQRRNEIAHGSFNGELESIEIVIERIRILKDFGAAISHVLTSHFLGIYFASSTSIELGKPSHVFSGINALGFFATPRPYPMATSEIKVGDMLFSKNDNSNVTLKYGKIISIMSNRVATDCVNSPSDTDFSLQVDFDINSYTKNRDIYVMPSV